MTGGSLWYCHIRSHCVKLLHTRSSDSPRLPKLVSICVASAHGDSSAHTRSDVAVGSWLTKRNVKSQCVYSWHRRSTSTVGARASNSRSSHSVHGVHWRSVRKVGRRDVKVPLGQRHSVSWHSGAFSAVGLKMLPER